MLLDKVLRTTTIVVYSLEVGGRPLYILARMDILFTCIKMKVKFTVNMQNAVVPD